MSFFHYDINNPFTFNESDFAKYYSAVAVGTSGTGKSTLFKKIVDDKKNEKNNTIYVIATNRDWQEYKNKYDDVLYIDLADTELSINPFSVSLVNEEISDKLDNKNYVALSYLSFLRFLFPTANTLESGCLIANQIVSILEQEQPTIEKFLKQVEKSSHLKDFYEEIQNFYQKDVASFFKKPTSHIFEDEQIQNYSLVIFDLTNIVESYAPIMLYHLISTLSVYLDNQIKHAKNRYLMIDSIYQLANQSRIEKYCPLAFEMRKLRRNKVCFLFATQDIEMINENHLDYFITDWIVCGENITDFIKSRLDAQDEKMNFILDLAFKARKGI